MKLQKTYNGRIYTLDVEIEIITPEKAAYNISTGKLNRKETNVDRYAIDMKNGDWYLTGQSVIFNDRGELVDGFNRSKASIKSRAPFVSLVVRGVEAKSFNVIDTGKSRSLADVLKMKNVTYVDMVSYILKRIVCLDEDREISSSTPTTRSEEIAALRRHPEVEDAAAYAHGSFGPTQGSLLAFLYWYYACALGDAKATTFFRDYASVVAYHDFNDTASTYIKGTAPFAEMLYTFFHGGQKSRPVKITKKEALTKAVGVIEAFRAGERSNHNISFFEPLGVQFTSEGVMLQFTTEPVAV